MKISDDMAGLSSPMNRLPLGGLSNPVRWIWRQRAKFPSGEDPKQRGALFTAETIANVAQDDMVEWFQGHWDVEGRTALAALTHASAVAISFGEKLVVHSLRRGCARLVEETDLHRVPSEAPRLLRGAWLLEAKHADRGEALYGNTISVAGYPNGDGVMLLGTNGSGLNLTRWSPRWTGEPIEETVPPVTPSLLVPEAHVQRHREWAEQTVRFALIFALLLEAYDAPVCAKDETHGGTKPRGKRGGVSSGDADRDSWTTRHVYIAEPRPEPRAPRGEVSVAERRPGLSQELVPVQGHLRRYHHGPGAAQVRWQYVKQHSARRWVSPGAVMAVCS